MEGLTAKAAGAKIERSKTMILVKNIPFETKEDELRSLFSKFGSLVRVRTSPFAMRLIIQGYLIYII